LLGGSRKVPYKPFRDGYTPGDKDKVCPHTQNLYVPGDSLGTTAFLILRDRERVDYRPTPGELLNNRKGFKAQRKDNIGVLEAIGTWIVDDDASFEEIKAWLPQDISHQIARMIAAITPDHAKVGEFETAIRDLFPA
jgi:hypothetical protein